MKGLIELLVFLLFQSVGTQQRQVANIFKAEHGSYFPDAAGITLNSPRPKTYVSCLIACATQLKHCSGVNVNRVTMECIGFQAQPLVDANGDFPNNPGWIRFYPGKVISIH